jgi:HEAT repeat protein
VLRVRRIAAGVAERAEGERGLTHVLAVLVLLAVTAGGAPAAGPLRSSAVLQDTIARPAAAESDTVAIVARLEELAMSDRSTRVRQEAAAELSDYQHPAAAAALMRIVRVATDAVVRAEAAQQLDEFPTDDVVAVLRQVVMEDAVAGVRDNALDVLDDIQSPDAHAALLAIARDHPNADVRTAAVAALSDGGR